MKELRCSDAGFDCDGVVQGESVDEVLSQVPSHAKDAHGIDVTPEMQSQLTGLVRDA